MTRDTTTLYYAVRILREMALARFALGQSQAFQALNQAADVIGLEADQLVAQREEEEAERIASGCEWLSFDGNEI